MKTYKKIGLGVISLSVFAVVFSLSLFSKTALAATPNFNLRFSDTKGSAIDGSYNDTSFKFDLKSSSGPNWVYQISGNGPVCTGSAIAVNSNIAQSGSAGQATPLTGQFYYRPSASSSGCLFYGGTLPVAAATGGSAQAAEIKWLGAKGVISADGSQITVTFSNNSTAVFTDSNPSTSPINFKPSDSLVGQIGGASVAGWCPNTAYGTGDANRGITLSSYTATSATVNICYNNGGAIPVNQTATFAVDASAYTSSGSGSGSTDSSCAANYNGPAHAFNWLFCGILEGMDSMFGTINGQVEAQLNICTGKSSTTGNTCGNNLLTPQVEKSWAVFRDLGTALLVIVMLIAVLSQAISVGPFDAYTVRKMLPKIVAAVILMQISWPLFKFFIDISNDLGHGVQDIMLAPFGGPGSFSFDNLIGSAGGFAPSLATVGLFTALVIGTVLSGLTIMGVMFLGATAILSVVVGLLVLLFRQMLLIMAMILAPLALLAWILPGTQKYWKLWSDNFTKLLLMFPLIMAMIAAGKIFAKIGVDTGTGIFGVIIVFVGFLGPLWLLPKTFKWGGQAFAAAANGTMNATKGLRTSPGKYALGQAKINREERANERAERLANNRGRMLDPLFAGRTNFALSRRARRDRYQDTLEKGRKTADEQAQRQVIGGAYEQLRHEDKVRADILVAQGRQDDQYGTGLDGREASQQRAALERLKKYGDWDAISLVREAGYLGEQGERVWQSFVAANIGDIHQSVPHLSPQRTDAARFAYGEYRGAKDFEFDEILRQAQGYQVRDAATGQLVHVPAADMAAKRAAHIEQAQRALNDTQFMASIGEHGRQVFEIVANLPQFTPEVQVIRNRNNPNAVQEIRLPSHAQLVNPNQQAAALDSVRSHLMHADAQVRDGTRARVVRELADQNLDPQVRQTYETMLSQLKQSAAGDPTSTAGNTFNAIVNDWHAQLNQMPAVAEQAETASGGNAASIAQARQNAQAQVNVEQGRMNNASLTVIP